ncbi:unnamed protein product [Parnassius apollo]|uniref:(apollo) hypothetical protein n=1 Tax=Parnassius apollo TaxID=110799 RepID=A0A8S3X717_PARAO|nr:unnamed protein product [Parnassius apollo]
MGDTEEYFPRGGKKPSVTYFKQSSNFLGAAEKGERKKQKPKKKTEDDDGYLSDEILVDDDQSFKNCAISLNYKIVKEGQLILGRVRQILETKIHISLPCRLLGTVMACHISEPYNKMLEAYVNDQIDKVRELQQMFRVGQYVAVKVLEVNSNNLMLSMMPQHINSGRSHSDLHRGALLQAAVSSVEDHGYVMDIGISNTRAFLPKTAANPEVELEQGTLSWCCVKTITAESDSSVVTLSSELVALQHAVQRRATDSLMPATALDFTVDKSLDNGIEGHVFENTTAYVQRQQVDKVKGKRPNLGQRIRARVLYVIPTRNTPFLTMKDIFATTYPDLATEQKFKEGDIIEEAQVIKILGRSIIFKLGRGSTGTLSLRRIQVDEDLTDEDVVAKSYPIGSTHRVRVLCYNLSDYTYSLSDEPAILSEKYFTIADLAVGDIVPATVKVVAEDRLHLAVGRLTGFVPQTHLSDSGVYKDPKKATTSQLTKKKYKVGQEVKARVLTLDPSKPSLILTLKPSLLVPELEVLKSYEQAEVGKAYTGVILHIRDYLLVSFFNGLVAHVPGKLVANPPPPTLNSVFHLGQIVNCTILKVDAKNKRMSGSLTTAPFEPSLQKKEKRTSKRKQEPEIPVPKKKQKALTSEAEIGEETEGDLTKKERKKKKDKRKLEGETQEVEMVYVNDKDTSDEKEHCDQGNNDNEETKKSKKKKDKTKSNKKETEKSDEEYELFKPDEEAELFTPDEEAVDKVLPHQSSKKDIKKRKRQISEPTIEESNADKQPTAKPDIKSKIKRDDDIDTNTDTSKVKRKEKKKKKEAVEISEKETKVNEESDAIETDIYEDSDQVLTPQDLGLIDMSDCSTAKSYKKRIKSLLKGIKARMLRIKKIDNKITAIERKGLNANNKKFHTAMHMEKLVIQQRIQKLMEALQIAQDRLKGFDLDEVKEYKKKKLKKTEDEQVEKTDVQKTESEKEKAKVTEKNKKSKIESLESVISIPSVKEFWSAPVESQPNAPEQDSSSSDDEEQEKPKKKRKKLTAAEKVAKAREEEERVRQLESFAVESDLAPRSAEQFERALLARPDASQLWIAYMAFHLQATEIEKARAVGRKALKTISFREEQEKLNVWLAMLNFEHRFGTKESQQKTLEEALQMNDKYQIHSKLLDIYVETGKPQELVALVELMLRKYRRELRSYIACGAACYRLALLDKARHVMQKGISLLEKKEHVGLLVQFAQLERAHGSGERAEALFEQLLAVYPQRVDVCAVYIDILVKSGDVEKVRQVMERMTSQKLPARKMKVLYKKWIEVEEKMGDQEHVDNIRKRAMEYIDKAKF